MPEIDIDIPPAADLSSNKALPLTHEHAQRWFYKDPQAQVQGRCNIASQGFPTWGTGGLKKGVAKANVRIKIYSFSIWEGKIIIKYH